ncbi:MAG: ABC-F family ATP-binding cassette domain-containing protein [Spirochaetia bacterium]|nr:ABC-F family ATP-binding cassette domain-containing protein [Spirochaetia bacterium]
MKTLQVQNISLAFGDRDLLKNVSFTLSEKGRAALAGANGSGKSTLLKIITNLAQCDSGEITKTKGMRISYLPQSDIVHSGTTLYEEVEKAFDRFVTIKEDISELEKRLAQFSQESSEVEQLLYNLHLKQESLVHSDYYRRDAVIERIVKGLGFRKEDLYKKCETFSGGWQMRIALSKVLAEDPDVMLLDEPTNYLDIESRIWLRNYIHQFDGAIMMVSHDQDFLDETINEVYELFQSQLIRYKGNYSQYVKTREEELEQLVSSHARQLREIEKTEKFIERFRYKASKAKQVQSREKQLDKVDIIEIPGHLKMLNFTFPPPPHCGNDVLSVSQLYKSYGSLHLFKDFSLHVNKRDRLAITGHNGAGKTTLLRILSGVDNDFTGNINLGSDVKVGYFAQDTEKTLNPEFTVYQEVLGIASTIDIPKLRSLLGSFLFRDDDIDKKISVLSGGEKSRLALLKILLHPVNLLILDEPTNHLDINAKHMLIRALKEYTGTLICVSHDTHFIKEIATSILYLSDDAPELFVGDYEYFSYKLEQKEALSALEDEAVVNNKKVSVIKDSQVDRKEYNKSKNRLQSLLQEEKNLLVQIHNSEAQMKGILHDMSKQENYSDSKKITSLINKKEELEKIHSSIEEMWFSVVEEIEQLHEVVTL